MTLMKKQTMKLIRKICIAVILFFLLVLAGYLYLSSHQVKHIYIKGNSYYSDQEIQDKLFDSLLNRNTLYLNWKYKSKDYHGIPFTDTVEIDVTFPDTVYVTVYEKSLIGYVDYLGQYLFFDKDGVVVESSSELSNEVPCITGLHFSKMMLYEPLEVEESGAFDKILEITKAVLQYGLSPTEIHFSKDQDLMLRFDEVRIILGDTEYLDEKLAVIRDALPSLEGKKGEMSLENYEGKNQTVSFQPDK